MKKILIYIIFTFLCFVGTENVLASEITYDIESIVISNDNITFKGWAYQRRVNNVGGDNLKISITATDNSSNITKNVSSYEYQDLYPIMCVRTASGNKCHAKTTAYERCNASTNYDSCLYDNGKFTLSFGLQELYNTFTTDEIFFDLNVEVSGVKETIRIGAYDGNIKNSSNKWEAITSASDSVYISVTSDPYYQTPDGVRYKPDTHWYYNNLIDINFYKKTTYKNDAGNTVNIGTYCNFSNQCAYASWVTASKLFSLKLEEKETTECNLTNNQNLMCEDGSFDSSCDIDIDAGTVYASGSGGCSGGSATVEAKVKIKQTGELKFSLDRGPIYSGGSFTFNVVYNNEASWEYAEGGYEGCPSISVGYKGTCCSTKTTTGPNGKPVTTTTCRSCCKSKTVKSSSCDSNAEYEDFINKAMANKYQGLDNSSAVVTMPDSNDVSGGYNSNTGTWDCESEKVSSWEPNTTLTSKCTFTLYEAFIEKDSSNVFYNKSNGDNYISKGNVYFVPLKYPTGNFGVSAVFSNLSSISDMDWSANYECDVECQQKLYDLSNGGYLYYFRPISLSSPFPNGRDPGINWVDWINDKKNRERLVETYSDSNNLEYTVTLSNSDIANIKKYNYNANYNGGKGYLDLDVGDNFDINGNSKFIKDYNYFTLGNVNHSGLGVFDPEDDMQ